jgi:hypothetical protein
MGLPSAMPCKGPAFALLAALVLPLGPALAGTVRVESYGIDRPGCGAKATPCRSLRYGIGEAGFWDTVKVGPGNYVDAPLLCGGRTAVVCIAKPIRVLSTDGAASTVIQGEPGSAPEDVVAIIVSRVVFGSRGHGFTIRGGWSGVGIEASGVRVGGHIVTRNGAGVGLRGDDSIVEWSLGFLNSSAFGGWGDRDVFRHLTALANYSGIGSRVGEGDHQAYQEDVAIGNDSAGLSIFSEEYGAGTAELESCSAIANDYGVIAYEGTEVRVSRSNLYGNDCALGLGRDAVVEAPANWWGAPGGPGGIEICTDHLAEARVARPRAHLLPIHGVGIFP